MLPIRSQLQELLAFYLRTRGVGHTRAALAGAASVAPSLLLVPLQRETQMPKLDGVQLVTVAHLTGRQLPLVVDNHALLQLLQDTLAEFSKYDKAFENEVIRAEVAEDRVETLLEDNYKLLRHVSRLRKQVKRLKDQCPKPKAKKRRSRTS